MAESLGDGTASSSSKKGTVVPGGSPNFGRVARLLWPRKTAAELAYRCGVSERAAKYWLAGKRKPTVRALMAILDVLSA
jgi:hypothetical protein